VIGLVVQHSSLTGVVPVPMAFSEARGDRYVDGVRTKEREGSTLLAPKTRLEQVHVTQHFLFPLHHFHLLPPLATTGTLASWTELEQAAQAHSLARRNPK
jgi:hypothetical protein